MTRIAVALALAAGLLAPACTPAPPPDTRAQDEAAIRSAETAWSAVINEKNVDKFVAYYSPDAVVMPPNMPIATTPAAIRTAIGGMLAAPGLSMTFQTTKVDVAKSGDMAFSYGTYDMSMTGPDGTPMPDKGKYATVWKKQGDGSWKAALDIFNTNTPMPPPPPPAKKK